MSKIKGETKEERKRRKQEKKEKKEKKKRKRDSSIEPSSSTALSQPPKVKRLDNEESDAHEKSAFQCKTASIMLSLAPSALSNTAKAMHASMQSMVMKYSDGLGGVLLSFDNVKVDKNKNGGSYGKILNEMPHMHFYVTCDVLVFNPSIGKSLSGVVNETFPSHVGVLVHELFNAMISAESLRESGFSFDADLNEWSKEDTLTPIAIDDSIRFTVEKLHECNGLISLECKDPVVIE